MLLVLRSLALSVVAMGSVVSWPRLFCQVHALLKTHIEAHTLSGRRPPPLHRTHIPHHTIARRAWRRCCWCCCSSS